MAGGPLGRPDEAVVVSLFADGRPGTLIVEVASVGGARRLIARVPAFGRLVGETWEPARGLSVVVSERGYLATVMQRLDAVAPSEVWVVDLREPTRPRARLVGGENGFGWGPDGRLAVIASDPGEASVADVPAASVAVIRAPSGIAIWPYGVADGSGWYAGPVDGPPTGIVAPDGSFRAGPLPPASPGQPRRWSAEGEQVDAEPDDGTGSRRVFTVARDGAVRDWYRFPRPDAREFGNGEVRWSADGSGLWVLDQAPSAYRIVRLDAPGADPFVAARIPYSGDPALAATTALAGLSADDSVGVIQRFYGEQPALTLVDLGTGARRDIAVPADAAAAEFAGWAAPP
jgi:hypothetical protein